MANYQYASDIIDAALFHAGEPIDGTSDYEAAALRYVNDIYQQIYTGSCELGPDFQEDWWWLYATSSILLKTEYDSGSISVTEGSASATLSAAPSISLAGYWIRVDNTSTPYKVSSHTASTTAVTLDSEYVGDTDATAAYTAFLTDYDLPSDNLRLLQPITVHGEKHPYATLITLREMQEEYPLGEHGTGAPKHFSMVDSDTIRFSHHGNDSSGNKIRVDVPYLQRPAALTGGTSEEPVMPLEYRPILAKYAAYKVLLNKNDDRATALVQEAATRYTAMVEENHRQWKNPSRRKGGLVYRPSQKRNRSLSTSTGVTWY